MERLENILKDLQGMARKLRDEIDDANGVINDVYLDVDNRGEMTPGNESEFEVVLNGTYNLVDALNDFLDL